MFGEEMVMKVDDPTLAEFRSQVAMLQADGLVDIKAMVSPSGDSSTRDIMWAFANALRLDRLDDMISDQII
jgi:hypothetical protein